MVLSVIIFLISIVPSVLILLWLKNRHKDELLYKKSCNFAMVGGFMVFMIFH